MDLKQFGEQRQCLRKQVGLSDALRDQIKAVGYEVEDTPQGSRVRAVSAEPPSKPGIFG